MNNEEKYTLIVNNLQEIIGEDVIKKILKERNLKVYWGTAITGKPHVGYFVSIFKIAELLRANCEVTVLFANLHGYLDNMKSSWELLEYRTQYYELLIKEMLKTINVTTDKLKFVKGTDFQLSEEYTLDVYKMSAILTIKSAQHSGAEVVKQTDNPRLSGLLYPILQALDEEYLNIDAQLGGIDQRKIFMLARDYLPKISYKKRVHLMHTLIPGLTKSGKMSSSEPDSKIDFEDTDKQVTKKINKAFSEDGVVEGNGLLVLMKYILFQYLDAQKKDFLIERPEEYGGNISFKNYEEVENAFIEKKLSSIDLKQGISKLLIEFIKPIKKVMEQNEDLIKKAYPKG